jgi:hypothetical protein
MNLVTNRNQQLMLRTNPKMYKLTEKLPLVLQFGTLLVKNDITHSMLLIIDIAKALA